MTRRRSRCSTRATLVCWVALAALGCGGERGAELEAGAPTGTTAPPAPATTAPAQPDPLCDVPARFGTLDVLPPSRFAMWIDRDGVDFAASTRAAGKNLDALEIPIHARFELEQLPYAIEAVGIVAKELGLDPREFILVHDGEGRPLWILPGLCDEATLEARARESWQLVFRRRPGGRIASAEGEPSAGALMPFDLVLSEEVFLILAPRGHGGAAARWMRGGIDSIADAGRARPGPALSELAEAPLKLRLEGAALAGGGDGKARLFRGGPQGWTPVVDSDGHE